MKPLHSNFQMLRRCPCCASKWSKRINGTAKHGNTAARQHDKREVNKVLKDGD